MVAILGCQPGLSFSRARGSGVGAPSGFGGVTGTVALALFYHRQEKAAALPGRVAALRHRCPTK